jgi:two-component system KDP operon response regulator KdpE
MNENRILVIDDEPQIHRFLKPALEAGGYDVERANTAAEGLRLTASRPPAAILLDLGLPDQDGQDTLLALRVITHAPILVISARDKDAEKVQALDAGADDYVEKPFAMSELLARLRACLRRALVQEGVVQPFQRDGLRVDLLTRRLWVEGEEMVLTPREYDLLAALVRNAGRVITHRQLLSMVWGPKHVEDTQYLRVHISHLRQKIGPVGSRLIRTEAGVGYRLLEPGAE